uniref:Uncharacterized protein n=1 Tax=Chromera velia CCMP2878 TaxID=1169474 RepID=A0A0G4HUR5_9ALVE|eukprot:Cvel_8710.t1-p1 / transcript=Cvel_8710.t1 / gene=Cvel_8710 / organism=Chromera_velia_CCMP2878 / gene_product=hypothetical protein / transcript_product=hypothetical protein / location=Cvel_scaffold486:46988-48520(-) / protein_length=511 / sequence_SO=supercontig / SO=protein_coding / is_pseudo=false
MAREPAPCHQFKRKVPKYSVDFFEKVFEKDGKDVMSSIEIPIPTKDFEKTMKEEYRTFTKDFAPRYNELKKNETGDILQPMHEAGGFTKRVNTEPLDMACEQFVSLVERYCVLKENRMVFGRWLVDFGGKVLALAHVYYEADDARGQSISRTLDLIKFDYDHKNNLILDMIKRHVREDRDAVVERLRTLGAELGARKRRKCFDGLEGFCDAMVADRFFLSVTESPLVQPRNWPFPLPPAMFGPNFFHFRGLHPSPRERGMGGLLRGAMHAGSDGSNDSEEEPQVPPIPSRPLSQMGKQGSGGRASPLERQETANSSTPATGGWAGLSLSSAFRRSSEAQNGLVSGSAASSSSAFRGHEGVLKGKRANGKGKGRGSSSASSRGGGEGPETADEDSNSGAELTSRPRLAEGKDREKEKEKGTPREGKGLNHLSRKGKRGKQKRGKGKVSGRETEDEVDGEGNGDFGEEEATAGEVPSDPKEKAPPSGWIPSLAQAKTLLGGWHGNNGKNMGRR